MITAIMETKTEAPAAQPDTRRAALGRRDGVQFLVFELAGQRYGVDVAEVEGLVRSDASAAPKEGVLVYEGEQVQVQPLAQWVGLPPEQEAASRTGNGSAAPGSGLPPVPGGEFSRLLLSRRGGTLNGLLVDMPRDIISLPLDAIFALPVLIRRLLVDSPLWGVGRAEDGLILLLDPASRRFGLGSGGGQEETAEEEL